MSTIEQDPPIEAEDAPQGVSLADRLRARRAEIAAKPARELVLVVPDYEDLLGVRYRYPAVDAEQVVAAAQRLAVSLASPDVTATPQDRLTVIVKCCHEIVARPTIDADWEPLDKDGDPDVPLRFTPRLASLLGFAVPDTASGRQQQNFIARNLFSPAAAATGVYEGDPALASHAISVAGWLQNASVDIDRELVGE